MRMVVKMKGLAEKQLGKSMKTKGGKIDGK
jgi:hypothetical protein